ncbi:TIGR02757 family protein [Patiriisocius marinistellae]|uniref:TIGR02757 family protein n=1 Tax=Patiriisocius marinistellae TaxID=2494560 RepID=A0A5J4FUX5_9FLAO|nr:TIGR02757 family protein [Patiriisocius marinistellae]GEQ86477.1 TIGR02757 family protein [Patiriisocius marinistellae]
MNKVQLKEFLDEKAAQYNTLDFIETDPIQIPHKFSVKEDIEISGFLIATIAWGNRKSIINNGERLLEIMGNSPLDFVQHYSEENKKYLNGFVHRTFNEDDLHYFFKALQNIYTNHNGLEYVFAKNQIKNSLQPAISAFKKTFFELPHLPRSQKHVSDPLKNSAAKRINMFLRWMVRSDTTGVDFGIWNSISPSILSCPLDVHSGGIARKLNILTRKQNDAKALAELDKSLREFDPLDPVKYDFALFGLGAFERF